jgi:hypothetical protein
MGAFAKAAGERRIDDIVSKPRRPVMRKILALLVLAVTAFAATAGTAAADDPAATTSRSVQFGSSVSTCTTPSGPGIDGRTVGAWGDFVDGCTTKVYFCRGAATCTITMDTYIGAYGRPFVNVTQNARLRVFKTRKALPKYLIWQQDSSCAGSMGCRNTVTTVIKVKQGYTAQCNGVKQHVYGEPGPLASNTCSVSMRPNL